ncbi:MAG: hypothetical protein Q7T79_03975 [bacterium]|nr:hypothetical protein [bacterium]
MDNQTSDQAQKEQKKTSKAIIAVFLIVLIDIFAFIFLWFSFEGLTSVIISLLFSLAFIYLIYYLRKRAVKKGLEGLKLASFSLYAFSIITAISLIGSLILIGYSNKLNKFAAEITPTFFENDFAALKDNSTERLKRLVSYEKEMENIKKELIDIGKVTECVKEKGNYNFVYFGPNYEGESDYEAFSNIGLTGAYSRRCYGEKKSFDIVSQVEYKNGKWLIDTFNLKSDINKEIFEKTDKDKKE